MIELYNDPEAPRNETEAFWFRICDVVADIILFFICPIVYAVSFCYHIIKYWINGEF